MFWSIDSCQNSESADQYRLTVSRAQVATHLVWVFSILVKCLRNKSCLWAALLKFWFPADLGLEESTGFYMFFTFLSIVTRWSPSTSNFYARIGQNLTGEFMRKIYAASGNLFTDSCSRQSVVSSCDVFNCLFLLDVQNEIQWLSRFFCISWLVCLLRFCLRNAPLVKVIGNPSFCHRFQKMSILTCPCWRLKRVESLKWFWPHSMPFRSSISTGKPELLLFLMCFFFFRFSKVKRSLCG